MPRPMQVRAAALACGAAVTALVLICPGIAGATPPPAQAAIQSLTVPNEPVNLVGPPETVIYNLFFQQVNAFASKASELKASGANPVVLHALEVYYVDHAGLTLPQIKAVFHIAAAYAKATAPSKRRVQELVASWRKARLAYSISEGPKPAPPLSELRKLEFQRDTELMSARLQLKSLLGVDGFYALEVYLHRTYGHIRPNNVAPPQIAPISGGSQQ